jgi:hypothetical protein
MVTREPMAADNGHFTVLPNVGLVLWTILAFVVIIAGIVCGLKGRWTWLLVGLLTGGLVWLYAATLPAEPGSAMERWTSRRHRRHAGSG